MAVSGKGNAVPIEIKELIIRAAIESPQEGRQAAAGGAKPSEVHSQDLVAECVEQVLEILRRERER